MLGFGVEGAAVAEFLLGQGARVSVVESKSGKEFDPELVKRLSASGAVFFFENAEAEFGKTDAIIRSPGIPPNHPWLRAAAEDSIPITSGSEIFFERAPATVVGVTGTKGKGTTSSFLYEMLKDAGKDAYLLGNIGVPALSVLSKLNRDSIVVYELSSFQLLEIKKSPHIAVVLMITEDHMDFHGSRDEYTSAKQNIVRFQTAGDMVIGNSDYEESRRIAASSLGRKFWVSRFKEQKEGAYLDGENLVISKDGQKYVVADKKDISIYGAHNLENALAACMAGALLGLSTESIRRGLQKFKGLPHRLELVSEKNKVKFFDDSISTTPESTIAAIRAFEDPKILILGGSSKNADFSGLAKEISSNKSVKALIGLGEEWERIVAAVDKAGRKDISAVRARNMKEAVRAASSLSEAGDVVLLSPACASFGMFRDYKERGEQFEREVNGLGS